MQSLPALLRITSIGLLVAVAACTPEPHPRLLEEGISDVLRIQRKAAIQDLEYAYALSVPRSSRERVTGEVTMRFRWEGGRAEALVVDFKDPGERVAHVLVNGRETAWTPVSDHIVVGGRALSPGDVQEVRITFTAGDEALNRNPDFLYTLFVPDRAHFTLPIFDQPDLKAPFSLTLDVPEEWIAVANGPEERVRERGDRHVYEFGRTQPIPSYLFAFAVGDFQMEVGEREGRSFRMFHRETDAEKVARNAPVIFDLHHTALSWLEDYTGIPYPYGKFDFVLLPPFQYGGMEHPGSIFYRQRSLMLDRSATQAQVLGRASLIAHETAHQWFGDFVTMAWFDDVWTKEVFANFMAAKIVHPSFPDLDHELRFFLAHHNTAYGVDRTPGANAIRQPLENLREAGTLYGAIIYQKAPIVMRQLELMVGEEAFREGMRTYLDRFRHGNATWPDLVEILDASSEQDLKGWSRVWVEEAGRPTVSVKRREVPDGALEAIRIEQEDPRGLGRVWPQRLEVVSATGESVERRSLVLVERQVEIEWPVGKPAPDYVLPNGGGVEYAHFQLDSESRDYLVTSLVSVRDPMVRGLGWVTLWDAVLEGELEPVTWYELLLRGVEAETEEQNLERVLDYLDSTFWGLLPEEHREARAGQTERVLRSRMLADSEMTVRAALFRTWRSVALEADAVREMRAIWAGERSIPGLDLSEDDFTALAAELALRAAPDADRILEEQVTRIENPDRRARFEFLRPALSADEGVREAFFESLGSAENREHEPWVLAGLGYLHHPLRRGHARRFVRPSLDLVLEIQRTGDIFFPTRWLAANLGSHSDPEIVEQIEAFLDTLPGNYPDRLEGKILQAADGVFRRARILHGTDH